MVPSLPWVKKNFDLYNSKYFGGKLPTPKFNLDALKGLEWGRYDPHCLYYKSNRKVCSIKDAGILTLSNAFDRPEQSVINTLLHEMIHEYVNLILRVCPENPHGAEFMSMADRINADGWNVEDVTFRTDDDKEYAPRPSIVLVISKPKGTDYRYWLCKVNPAQIPQFEATASKIPGTTHAFYEINTDCFRDCVSDPVGLTGYHGMSWHDMVKNICEELGESPENLSAGGFRRYTPSEEGA